MRRNFLYSCFACLLFSSSSLFGQLPEKTEYNNEAFHTDLYGPAKSQRLIVTASEKLPRLRDVGQTTYILEEKYNKNQIRTIEQLFNTEGLQIGKSEILHDKNGFATEVLYTDLFDNLINRITYEFNKDGNWERVTKYDVYYNPMEILYYDYTPEKYIAEIKKTDEGGNLLEKQVFLYDNEGNKTELIGYGKDGKQESHTEYLYDTHGNVLSYRTLSGEMDEMILYYEATYANDSTLTSSTIEEYEAGLPVSRIEYTFDPLGNILKKTETNLKQSLAPQITEYLYEWDLWGNWTRQVIRKDGTEQVAAERSVVYYQ